MSESNLRPAMGPPVMGFQDPPDFDGRVGAPWLVISLFVLLAMAVAFAGGTGFGYSLGHGKAAAAAPSGPSEAETTKVTAMTVQTLRAQLLVYRLQHMDSYPTLAQLQDNWGVLMRQTNAKGALVTGPKGPSFGPYIQAAPVNPLNGKSNVCPLGSPTLDAGWAYNPAKGEIRAIAPTGTPGDAMPNDIVVHVQR
jgi:hypothetical protein